MITKADAELIAATWLYQERPVGVEPEFGMREFDLGYVFWLVLPVGLSQDIGSGRVVVDRATGELTHWPSVPPDDVAEMYRQFRATSPAAPLTWDPLVQARHDRVRTQFPTNVSHLRLADGRLRLARSMKGDGTPAPHPIVRDFLDTLPARRRERGYDRCSEVAVLSDALYAEDTRRQATGEPPLTVEDVRTGFLAGARLVTYRVREQGDPLAGESAPPCGSCLALLRHCGFLLQAPPADATDPASPPDAQRASDPQGPSGAQRASDPQGPSGAQRASDPQGPSGAQGASDPQGPSDPQSPPDPGSPAGAEGDG